MDLFKASHLLSEVLEAELSKVDAFQLVLSDTHPVRVSYSTQDERTTKIKGIFSRSFPDRGEGLTSENSIFTESNQ